MNVQKAADAVGKRQGFGGGGEIEAQSHQEATPFVKVPSSHLSKPGYAPLNIFHNTFVKEPSVHVFILFLRGIWVMMGLKETEVFTTPARFGERVD